MLELLLAPLAACLILTGIHCYLGIHVLMREVIFVDLALAQLAAMGAACGTLFGFPPHGTAAYVFALGFTFFGAMLFALGRFRDRRVPQEAVIGIVYAVSSAVTVLVLSKSPVGKEEIEHMLVGRLLFVDWPEVGRTLAIYSAIAVVHVLAGRRFFSISGDAEGARRAGINVRFWDFLFYMTFGIVVTSSVQMAGVLLVFSFLIVPATCAMMFLTSTRRRLLAGWGIGIAASAGGLVASAAGDFPTGASVVGVFGVLFVASAAVYAVKVRTGTRSNPQYAPRSRDRKGAFGAMGDRS